jgi:hypothetical protein
MDKSRRVYCGEHGDRRPTFVCRHLVRGSGLGFYTPIGPPVSDDESDEQCAWCEACEQVRQRQRGWDDESEAFAGVTMICDACFEMSRIRNRLGTETA